MFVLRTTSPDAHARIFFSCTCSSHSCALCMAQVQGKMSCASFTVFHIYFILWCLCWTSRIVVVHLFCPRPLFLTPDPQRLPHTLRLAESLTQHQTLVLSPSSPTSSDTRIRSTRRSTSLTSTTIFCAQTTPPWFPPVQKAYWIPKHSFSSSKQAAASRVSSLFGHPGLWKRSAGHVSSRPGLRVGQRICCDNAFYFTVEWEKRSRNKRCAFVERSLNGKLTWPSEGREKLSRNCIKLRLRLRREIVENLILHFRRSIKNLNVSDFSYIKQVDGQIRLRGTTLACMENWNWRTDSSEKIAQKIAETLKN